MAEPEKRNHDVQRHVTFLLTSEIYYYHHHFFVNTDMLPTFK